MTTVRNTEHANERAIGVAVGGSTSCCHEGSAAIDEAAVWYREHRDTCERPVLPALRQRFGLSALEAVIAIREARRG